MHLEEDNKIKRCTFFLFFLFYPCSVKLYYNCYCAVANVYTVPISLILSDNNPPYVLIYFYDNYCVPSRKRKIEMKIGILKVKKRDIFKGIQ